MIKIKAVVGPAVEGTQENMEAYTKQMIQYAESLYDLASRDDVWQQKQGK